jgi:hypothetical protein
MNDKGRNGIAPFSPADFQGTYGFAAFWGARRLATLGMAQVDGRGGMRGSQRLNGGLGGFVNADFTGGYRATADGGFEVTFTFPNPVPGGDGGAEVTAFFYFVPFSFADVLGRRRIAELRGVDRSAAFNLLTGEPFVPPELGEGIFKLLF